LTAKETFLNAKNFSVYYGKDSLNELLRFDIAIIEPMAQNIATIRVLQEKGVLVFAYLSVVEVHPEHAEFNLYKDSLLKVESDLVMNQEFHTYYADLRAEKWMRHLYRKADIYLTEYGCDGLFLDTIGNLEDARIPANTRYALIEAAVAFLEKIKKNFNRSLLIQNNGLGLLLHYTKDSIDGICWENPRFGHGITGRINKVVTKKLQNLQTEKNMKILLLTEESEKRAKIMRFASQNRFLYYNAPHDYIRI